MTTPNITVSSHSETHDYVCFRARFAGRCSAYRLLSTWVAFYFNQCVRDLARGLLMLTVKVVTRSETRLAGELSFLWVVLYYKLIQT